VVLAIDGAAVEPPDALGYRLATIGPGGTTALTVLSRGRERTVDIVLARPPETRPAQETLIKGASPFAGAVVANLSPRLRQRMNLPGRGDGVVVTQIERGAPALRAGLRPGDIIVAVNGLPIETVDDVIRLADSGGRSWRFTLNRQGRTINQFLRF